jgi:excisionase family DNA binding protein
MGLFFMTQRQFLTREEARTLLRFSDSKMDTETRSGRLKVHRFGRLLRIDMRDLEDYIQRARETAGGGQAA